MKNIYINRADYNSIDNSSQIDLNEQKYQKFKYLIENSIRLYGEFWGIFSTNITSNINTTKLYSIGEKLNKYLNEINNLWDELKNKKIGNGCQSIVQLYSNFLLEILWDRKKSREVYKKLNEDYLNKYHLNENKILEKNINKDNRIEQIIDNENFLLFCDYDEKINFKIRQCSTSFSQLLGYEKYNIIGKSFEIILPNILIEDYFKYIEDFIKGAHFGQNNRKNLSYSENDSNKNSQFIIVKSNMGYIFPLFSTIKIIEDNDYSDSILIKFKMENKEPKSEYAYYILAKSDLSIDNISSGAINLGLSQDLLKNYIVKLEILIRSEKDIPINIYEKYSEFEEEPKIITWVYPYIIYPKDNNKQKKDEEIEELIEKSKKKRFNMQIKAIKFNENENIKFFFKFTEIINLKKNKKNIDDLFYIPDSSKKIVMFDLLNLKYIRTHLVDKKTGLRNLKNIEDEKEEKDEKKEDDKKKEIKKYKKRKISTAIELSSDDFETKENNILTKDKILELQGDNFIQIRNFIFSLPVYGKDITLEKFRPNRDKYSAGKITEPSIKIKLSDFCKRIDETALVDKNLKRKKKIIINDSSNSNDSLKSSSNNDYLLSSDISSNAESINSLSNFPMDNDINKGFASNSALVLTNIFKVNSIRYIKILITSSFLFITLFILGFFIIVYKHLNQIIIKIDFISNGYIILNDIIYTKLFVTEGVIANSNFFYFPSLIAGGKLNFINDIKNELLFYRQEFSETYEFFTSNKVCKEYRNFMNKKIEIYSLTLDMSDNTTLLLNSAMNRIASCINNIVADTNLLVMNNRDTYELMYNLINEYYINWEKVIQILLKDAINATKFHYPLLLIMIFDFFISLATIFIFLLLLSRFVLDREKPINLFLTLKKKVFENLKTCADNFSNKLLNKFFGNIDNEEQSQKDYTTNIQPNDINIAKFKAATQYNNSIIKAFSYISIIIIISIFFFFNLVYFIFIYLNFKYRMEDIYQFITLFDKTNSAQTNLILYIDIFKSYLFDKSIPILNNNNTKKEFIETFINISDSFDISILFSSKNKSFLSNKYAKLYRKYLLENFGELLNTDYYQQQKDLLENKIKNGFKPVQARIFEIIRYFTLKYYNLRNEPNKMSSILKLTEFKLAEINMTIKTSIQTWYRNILKLLLKSFYEFLNKRKLIYIILFICLIVFVVLYYFIIWKTYEEKLNILLKESSDLINLIPQEIKNIIIEKLNG